MLIYEKDKFAFSSTTSKMFDTCYYILLLRLQISTFFKLKISKNWLNPLMGVKFFYLDAIDIIFSAIAEGFANYKFTISLVLNYTLKILIASYKNL